MTEQAFSLIPFPTADFSDIEITGTVSLEDTLLAVHYALTGDIEEVMLPRISATPGRKDELWKTTCFEFFLALKAQSHYWEFNLSPSGDWNVYRMEAYRKVGFGVEPGISQLPFMTRKESSGYFLDLSVDLAPILERQQELEMAVTAVIQLKNGNETYWALTHPASQPDFHLRQSFILALAGQTPLLRRSAQVG